MTPTYLTNTIKLFSYYKSLGHDTFKQLEERDMFWRPNEYSNNIAQIIQHLSGNMKSRWTDIFTSDGEKDWRNRDQEFDDLTLTKTELIDLWNDGWECLFNTLNNITDTDLSKIIYIRNEGHSVLDAIQRQLAHYPYHVGQIVYIGKAILENRWKSLSIAKGESNTYNEQKFNNNKTIKHFTDNA